MTEAGTPKLNRHVPREEAQARIDEALRVAREAVAYTKGSTPMTWPLKNAMEQIIRILEDGR